MWEPYTIDLQSFKPKRFGVKLQDLRKQALYVRILRAVKISVSS